MCSRYLKAFDCLIVHFWFHELELTVEFIINDYGFLDSLIVEGPIFRSPGNYVQVRFEVYTKYSSIYGDVIRNHGDKEVLIRILCEGVRRELFIQYSNEDFINNPCKYAGNIRGIASNPNDDLTLKIITNVMSNLGITPLGEKSDLLLC